MTTIYFAGDGHGHFQHVIDVVLRDRPTALVLLGDLEAVRPLEQELAPILGATVIKFIHGNHDTDAVSHFNNVFRSSLAEHNLHGRVDTVGDQRIAGLGGVFRGKVWMPPAPPLFTSTEDFLQSLSASRPPRDRHLVTPSLIKHYSTIFPTDYRRLLHERATILVTHEAPSCHPHGYAAIDDLARAVGAKVVFHGHHHDRRDYSAQWEALGFKVFGVGFRGITSLTGDVIVPGTFDS